MKKLTFIRPGGRAGYSTTSELMLVAALLVIGLIAGWMTVRNAVNAELEDFAESAGDVNQSHASVGVLNDNDTASSGGSLFADASDDFAADSDDGNNDGDVGTEMTMSPP